MLEIIAATVEDAIKIEAGGADRIELVGALSEGGLTPSYGMMDAVIGSVKIPVNVMIRPHAKSFCYTKKDLDVMLADIRIAKQLSANGVVFGALTDGDGICRKALERLLPACEGMEATFHRAIDEIDPVEAIAVLAEYPQITNVLTSGGKTPLKENYAVLRKMIERAGKIRILVGGGLTADNFGEVRAGTGAPDYHFGTAARAGKSAFGEIDAARLAEIVRLAKAK